MEDTKENKNLDKNIENNKKVKKEKKNKQEKKQEKENIKSNKKKKKINKKIIDNSDKKNLVSKIFFLIVLFLFISTLLVFGTLYYNHEKLNKDINNKKNEIEKQTLVLENDKENLAKLEESESVLKESLKDRIEEVEIWDRITEKLETALQ